MYLATLLFSFPFSVLLTSSQFNPVPHPVRSRPVLLKCSRQPISLMLDSNPQPHINVHHYFLEFGQLRIRKRSCVGVKFSKSTEFVFPLSSSLLIKPLATKVVKAKIWDDSNNLVDQLTLSVVDIINLQKLSSCLNTSPFVGWKKLNWMCPIIARY